MYNLVVFSIFCKIMYHHCLVLGALSRPQKGTPHPLLGFTPHFPFYLWSLMTPSLFSVSEFAYLDTLWK